MQPIDVHELLAKPGSSRTVTRSERVDGLGTELGRVPPEEPLRFELRLESVVEGILASGRVTAPVRYACARCLTAFGGELHADVAELFAERVPEGDDEAYPITEAAIDVEPMLRDAVLLQMPFAPLCREDCLGLCERCGGDRNAGECSCGPAIDERWATLDGLRLD